MEIYLTAKRPSFSCLLLKHWLPESGKRMIFSISLICFIATCFNIKKIELSRIKQQLALTPSLKSMELPTLVYQRIWKGFTVGAVTGDLTSLTTLKNTIKQNCPQWLVYGAPIHLDKDIDAIFTILQLNQPTA